MTESHAFGSNLTPFLMRSHSIETADLERSPGGQRSEAVVFLNMCQAKHTRIHGTHKLLPDCSELSTHN